MSSHVGEASLPLLQISTLSVEPAGNSPWMFTMQRSGMASTFMAAVCSKASDVTFFVKVTVRTVVRPSGSTAVTWMVCAPFRMFRHSSAVNEKRVFLPERDVVRPAHRAVECSPSRVTAPPCASVTVYW